MKFEILKTNTSKDQTDDNKLPVFRVDLKMFTRFLFKPVFRVSGTSVPQDVSVASRHTDVRNFQVLFLKAYWSVNKWYINIS